MVSKRRARILSTANRWNALNGINKMSPFLVVCLIPIGEMNGHTTRQLSNRKLTSSLTDRAKRFLPIRSQASLWGNRHDTHPSSFQQMKESESGASKHGIHHSKGRTVPPLVSTMKLYDHLFDKFCLSQRNTRRKKSLLTRCWRTQSRSREFWVIATSRNLMNTCLRLDTRKRKQSEPSSG